MKDKQKLMLGQKPSVHSLGLFHRPFSVRRSRSRAGFSLVELLVVISVTMLLLSIAAAVSINMLAEARKSQVRSMMEGLKGAHEEFKVLQKNSLNISGGYPFDWSKVPDSGKMSSCEMFVFACLQNSTTEKAMLSGLRSISEENFKRTYIDGDGDGFMEIRDRWGEMIEFRPSNDGKGLGPSTGVSNADLPITSSGFFVSAGKDKTFGTDDDITTED